MLATQSQSWAWVLSWAWRPTRSRWRNSTVGAAASAALAIHLRPSSSEPFGPGVGPARHHAQVPELLRGQQAWRTREHATSFVLAPLEREDVAGDLHRCVSSGRIFRGRWFRIPIS